MKFVFFGTPDASVTVLETLAKAGYVPAAVVTNPDRPVGRKGLLTPPPVKQFISGSGFSTHIFQPEKVLDISDELKKIGADLFIVAFYNKLIPQSVLDIPAHGTVGVHPSLLPVYRGPSPIQTAILDAAPEVGMTVYQMDAKMDEGPILAQEKLATYHVGEKNNTDLWNELAALGGTMLAHLIPHILDGTAASTTQDHSRATYTKKFSSDDACIPEENLKKALAGLDEQCARNIHQLVLAFTPEPGAWTMDNGKRLKILKTEIVGNRLVLKTIQREGKTPIDL